MTFCTPTPIPDTLPIIEYSNYVCPDDVINKCLNFFGITISMLKNKSREREVLRPRQLVTYVLCKHTELTLTKIAKSVGYKDHTIVIHTRDRVEYDLFTNRNFKAEYNSLIQYLKL